MPFSPSARKSGRMATRPASSCGTRSTSTPWLRRRCTFAPASVAGLSASAQVATASGASPCAHERTSAQSSGMRRRESSTTRSGWLPGSPSRRQVSSGSSAITVLMPTTMAARRWRSSWVSRRDSGPLTQRASPEAQAILPSALMAHFATTYGVLRLMKRKKTGLSSSHSPRSVSSSTWMPASRNRADPLPATSGFGSRLPTITRATPAAMSASVHGGCLPVWQHGSSVT